MWLLNLGIHQIRWTVTTNGRVHFNGWSEYARLIHTLWSFYTEPDRTPQFCPLGTRIQDFFYSVIFLFWPYVVINPFTLHSISIQILFPDDDVHSWHSLLHESGPTDRSKSKRSMSSYISRLDQYDLSVSDLFIHGSLNPSRAHKGSPSQWSVGLFFWLIECTVPDSAAHSFLKLNSLMTDGAIFPPLLGNGKKGFGFYSRCNSLNWDHRAGNCLTTPLWSIHAYHCFRVHYWLTTP